MVNQVWFRRGSWPNIKLIIKFCATRHYWAFYKGQKKIQSWLTQIIIEEFLYEWLTLIIEEFLYEWMTLLPTDDWKILLRSTDRIVKQFLYKWLTLSYLNNSFMNVWHLYTINSHELLAKNDNTKMFQVCHGLFTSYMIWNANLRVSFTK